MTLHYPARRDDAVWGVPEAAPPAPPARPSPAAEQADLSTIDTPTPRQVHRWFKASEIAVLVVAMAVLGLGVLIANPAWLHWTLLGAGAALLVLAIVLMAGWFRRTFVVKAVLRASEEVVDAVQKPITLAVLDEVADVLRNTHFTPALAAALTENHNELRDMIREKIDADQFTGRFALIPFHERIIDLVSETTLRVILAVLADPRTDELFSDVLRDGVTQVRSAIHDKD